MKPLLLTLTLLLTPALALAAPQVTATLKPLRLIAEAITDGISQPQQLLSAAASPHDYQLRPSDLRALQEADLTLWVGPAMEPFLQKPLRQLGPDKVLTLLPETLEHPEGVPSAAHADSAHSNHRDAGHSEHEEAGHAEHEEAGHAEHEAGHAAHAGDHPTAADPEHHDHDHGNGDPHLWLDPLQGIAIAEQLTRRLAELDPANAAAYRANLAAFSERVEAVDQALKSRLAPLAGRGYFVFHDGYRHFERHYGLNHLGAFTLSPQHRPGARQLAEIRAHLEASDAHCVFSEPQYSPKLIEAVTEGVVVRHGRLDPLAMEAGSYPAFLEQLGEAFVTCLSDSGSATP